MKISKNGLKAIREHEGVRNKAYLDSGGVWTVGVGHTAARGAPIPKKGLVLTDEEVLEVLDRDLDHFEGKVNGLVKVPLSQNQFDALVSLCFNIGEGAFANSTLLRKLNNKDYQGAADQFLVWVKVGGKKVQGLVNRRVKERSLFLNPVSAVRTPEVAPEPIKEVPATPVPEVKESLLVKLLRALRSLFK